MRLIFIDFLQYMQPFPKINSVNKREGAVHILRQPDEGVWQMLTIADEGGVCVCVCGGGVEDIES